MSDKYTGARSVRHHYLWRRDGAFCSYCGYRFQSHAETTIDHVIPKALGGRRNHEINQVLACQECNQRKGHQLMRPLRGPLTDWSPSSVHKAMRSGFNSKLIWGRLRV